MRRWNFLAMHSFQISSRDILSCLCTVIWIMNDHDWGTYWRESPEQSCFSHFNIQLPLCSWSFLPTLVFSPLQKIGRETPPITTCKFTQMCLTGTEEWLVYFPWTAEVAALESERHRYSLGLTNELGKNPPSFRPLNVVKIQTKTSFFSYDILAGYYPYDSMNSLLN